MPAVNQSQLRQRLLTGSDDITFTNVATMLIYNSGGTTATLVASVAGDDDIPIAAGTFRSLPLVSPNVYASITINPEGGAVEVLFTP